MSLTYMYDNLSCQVRDGDRSTSPLVERFCGSTLPGTIYSSGNSMWIEFHSDSGVTRTGFVGYFEIFDPTGMFTIKTYSAP